MPQPKINIAFLTKAYEFIAQSEKGVVALILKDDSVTAKEYTYTSFDQVKEAWSADNKKYIEFAFLGNPKKVITFKLSTSDVLTDVLKLATNRKWNYISFPSATSQESTTIISWLKTQRNTNHKTYKLIVGGATSPDDRGIINFDSDNVEIDGTKYSKTAFTSRIAGIAAGISTDKSMTYYILNEVDSFDELADDAARDAAVDAGKLILINDGVNIKIARGVNSLTTTSSVSEDVFKKIRIVDTIDQIQDDIRDTIANNWVGKKINTYDNKLILIAAINSYLRSLAKQQILDENANNIADIDLLAQKSYLESIKIDTSEMSEQQIRVANTSDKVFLRITIRPTDAMEDFSINIYM